MSNGAGKAMGNEPFACAKILFAEDDDGGSYEPMDASWDEAFNTPPGSPTQHSNSTMPRTPEPRIASPSMVAPSPCVTRQPAILTLFNAPRSPRSLMNRGRGIPNVPDSGRPSTAVSRVRKTNINPFTPTHTATILEPSPAKRQLEDAATPRAKAFRRKPSILFDPSSDATPAQRLEMDFELVRPLGRGEFGCVNLYRHRLDGVLYAIKRSNEPIHGINHEQQVLREVYAHAVLQEQTHIVRYHSAWEQDGYMVIQNEYCDGGTLADEIALNRRSGNYFSEEQLCTMLQHVARGLAAMHAQDLVHLDIKPGNIFLKSGDGAYVYKIGDLGHVTKISAPNVDDEGDCRYLPKEVLQQRFSAIAKADIFSLGLTIYEAATLQELPKHGPEWHRLRDGEPPACPRYSSRFNDLVESMIKPDATARPTAAELLEHPLLVGPAPQVSSTPMSAEHLALLLQAERKFSDKLVKQLKAAQPSSGEPVRHPRQELLRHNSVNW